MLYKLHITVGAILVEGIMRHISLKLVSGCGFKINSKILSAGGNHFQQSRNNLVLFGRIHHKQFSD